MSPQPRKQRKPVSEAVEEATRHAEARTRGSRGRRGGRPSDVFGGELRRRDLFPLLVLHLVMRERTYGNLLIESIEDMTQGVISVNPNTMYPLLRDLEGRGLIEGKWEHPDRRTRRFYAITPAGRKEYRRLRKELKPFFDSVIRSVTLIEREIYGDDTQG
jgi:PadR family transcriptional regulator PadR